MISKQMVLTVFSTNLLLSKTSLYHFCLNTPLPTGGIDDKYLCESCSCPHPRTFHLDQTRSTICHLCLFDYFFVLLAIIVDIMSSVTSTHTSSSCWVISAVIFGTPLNVPWNSLPFSFMNSEMDRNNLFESWSPPYDLESTCMMLFMTNEKYIFSYNEYLDSQDMCRTKSK